MLLHDKKRQNRNRKDLVTAFTPRSSPCFHGGFQPTQGVVADTGLFCCSCTTLPAVSDLHSTCPSDPPRNFLNSPGTESPEHQDGNLSCCFCFPYSVVSHTCIPEKAPQLLLRKGNLLSLKGFLLTFSS